MSEDGRLGYCPTCGAPLCVRKVRGQNFKFMGCSAYPLCRFWRHVNARDLEIAKQERKERRQAAADYKRLKKTGGNYLGNGRWKDR